MPSPKKLRIPDDVQTFGQALRWAREERKMTMRQACNAIGITPPFWCDLEHDRRETSRVTEIARVLGVELADLERRQGMSADLKDWLSKNPKLMRLIRDIRARRCSPLILKAIKGQP